LFTHDSEVGFSALLFIAITFCYKEYVGTNEEIAVSGDEELHKCSQSEEWVTVELATHWQQNSLLMYILSDAHH
jgi:hypothetical protein